MGGRLCGCRQFIIYMVIITMTILVLNINTPVTHFTVKKSTCSYTWTHPEQYPHHFNPRVQKVTPLGFEPLIPGDKICGDSPVDMMLLVVTTYEHGDLRDMIRETWGKEKTLLVGQSKRNIRVVFMFGVSEDEATNANIKREAREHEDVVMFDFKESYFNLTYKVLRGLQWVQTTCPQAKFVLKCDDDTFLNLPKILERVGQNQTWSESICGYYSKSERVERNHPHSKVSFESYPFQYYPQHVKGRTYFMPTKIAREILRVAEHMPYVNMEDVHVTGILAKAAGIEKFVGFAKGEYHPFKNASNCEILDGKVLLSSTSAKSGLSLWKDIKSGLRCDNIKQKE